MTTTLSFSTHDSCPPADAAVVDSGLGSSNDAAAALHEVRAISCFARAADGQVAGGAIGRWWGRCCELQQLWVEPSHRRHGVGAALVQLFEAHALRHGCASIYLETFSFQAPSFYRSHGYEVEYERTGYPHGISKFHMSKRIAQASDAQPQEGTTQVIVRISKGSYPPSRHAEFTQMMADAGQVLIPAIRKLPGCVSYFAATDETSSTMVNVSVWDTPEHARAMATLPEMAALAKEFIALGAEFERPIVNYQSLWQIP